MPVNSIRRSCAFGQLLMLLAAAGLSSCASTGRTPGTSAGAAGRIAAWPWTISPTVADSIRSEILAPGVRLHHLVRNDGPLRAHVLDIDLSSCVSMHALKNGNSAVGRATTTALLGAVPPADAPIAAVNADFFLFAPPGVPVGALVQNGRLVSGPVARAVLAFDRQGKPFVGTMTIAGTLASANGTVALASWNRPAAARAGIVDAAWGQPLDSLVRPTARMLVPVRSGIAPGAVSGAQYRVATLPAAHSGQALGDTVMLIGKTGTSGPRDGDIATLTITMGPIAPWNVVGGFPMLVRDSVLLPAADSAGADSFRGLNPRTAAGYAANGRRLLLVVMDGRQAGYSMGTTTRATAELMRDLGAREAVNLDGGGSTAMVVRDAVSGALRVVNRPSDAAGERPVGNALAVLGSCRDRSTGR